MSTLTGIYLDHAATTPLRAEVRSAMEPYLDCEFANPSSIYRSAQRARAAIDQARDTIAACLGAHASEIVFTSGGTESNNAAVKGAALALRSRGKHVITTAIEHHAVLHPVEDLAEMYGFESTVTPVGPDGIVDPRAVEAAIGPDTVLMSVMWANNEIGTIQPIAELAQVAHDRGITSHTDAVQAAGTLLIDLSDIPIDLLSISAHKFYGPKGVGALFVRQGTPWRPLLTGGAHERNRRAGTENVAGIVGMATALELACRELAHEAARQQCLRDYLIGRILSETPGSRLNGDAARRLPNNVNISFDDIHGESLLVGLDLAGVMASSGSACSSGSTEPSHVLAAIGLSDRLASSSLRMTLGHGTTKEEIDRNVAALVPLVQRLQSLAAIVV